MRNILFSLFLFLSLVTKAQTVDFDNYQPIQSSGALPIEFSSTSTQKYFAKKDEINKSQTQLEIAAQDQYNLENAFALDDILKNGKVLFNDTMSNYLTAVMAKILENREKKKKVRVYCIQSSVVNAYAAGDGIVFVTTGLLANVRNEAQIAFILSHEYMHHVYKHSIKGYIESRKIGKGLGDYGDLSMDRRYLATKAFSREQESEADLKGFQLYAKSAYSFEDVDSSFQVLKYSYLPFGNLPFKRDFVESGTFKTPNNYWLTDYNKVDSKAYEDAINGIIKVVKTVDDEEEEFNEEEEDKSSTHPSIEKRIEDLHDLMWDEEKKERKHFIVSKDAFFLVQKIARFELVRLNLLEQNYERALYNSYNLLQEDPNSKYLRKSVCKALYGISFYANSGNMNLFHVKKKYAQGEWQQVPNLIGKLKGEGVTVWAINYIWNAKKYDSSDIELKLIFDDVLKSLLKTYVGKKKDFVSRYEDTTALVAKNKKLKPFIRLGLLHLFVTDSAFKKGYDLAFTKYVKEKAKVEVVDDEADTTTIKRTEKEERKEPKSSDEEIVEGTTIDDITIRWDEKLVNGKTKYVGDGKILFLTPHYYRWTVKDEEGILDYLGSETGREQLIYSLYEVFPKVLPTAEILDRPIAEEVDKLNELSVLNDWVTEKMANGKLTMVAVDYERVQAIAKKYDVADLTILNVSSVKKKPGAREIFNTLVYGVLLLPALPIIMYYNLTPRYTTNLYFISLNFKDDKIIYTTNKKINSKTSNKKLKSQLNLCLLNLRNS